MHYIFLRIPNLDCDGFTCSLGEWGRTTGDEELHRTGPHIKCHSLEEAVSFSSRVTWIPFTHLYQ